MNLCGVRVNRIPGKWLTREQLGNRLEALAVVRAGAKLQAVRHGGAPCHSPCGGQSHRPGNGQSSSAIKRSRVTLAMIEAAAIESDLRIALDNGLDGAGKLRRPVAVDQGKIAAAHRDCPPPPHGPQGGSQNVVTSMRASSPMPMPTFATGHDLRERASPGWLR